MNLFTPEKIPFDIETAVRDGFTVQEIAQYLAQKAGVDYATESRRGRPDEDFIQRLSAPHRIPPEKDIVNIYNVASPVLEAAKGGTRNDVDKQVADALETAVTLDNPETAEAILEQLKDNAQDPTVRQAASVAPEKAPVRSEFERSLGERAIQAYKKYTTEKMPIVSQILKAPAYSETVARSFAKGTLETLGSVGTLVEFLANRVGADALAELGRSGNELFDDMADKIKPEVGRGIFEKPELMADPLWWAATISETAPSMLVALLPAMGTTAAIHKALKGASGLVKTLQLARIGGSVVGGLVGGSLEGMNTYREVLRRSGDEPTAAKAGVLMTAASAGLNALSFATMLGKLGVGRFAQAGIQGLTEGFTELMEEPAEAAILHYQGMGDKEKSLIQAINESIQEGLDVFPPSFVIGMLMPGGNIEMELRRADLYKQIDAIATEEGVNPHELLKVITEGKKLGEEKTKDAEKRSQERKNRDQRRAELTEGLTSQQPEVEAQRLAKEPLELPEVPKELDLWETWLSENLTPDTTLNQIISQAQELAGVRMSREQARAIKKQWIGEVETPAETIEEKPAVAEPIPTPAAAPEEAAAPVPTMDSATAIASVEEPAPETAKEIPAAEIVPETVKEANDLEEIKEAEGPQVAVMKTEDIDLDESGVLQWRKRGKKRNVTQARIFDKNMTGTLGVWRDPETGKVWVVDGHHRLSRAKETGETKYFAVEFIDVKTAEKAKAVGALRNIAAGSADALDAAFFFKEGIYTEEEMIGRFDGPEQTVAREGIALARLPMTVLKMVERGELKMNLAVEIGRELTDIKEQTEAVEVVIRRKESGKQTSEEWLSDYLKQVKAAPIIEEDTGINLFGDGVEKRNVLQERTDVISFVRGQIKNEKSFGNLAKKAEGVEKRKIGKIDTEAAKVLKQEADKLEALFDAMANTTGPVSAALNEAAISIAKGENADAAKQTAYTKIRETLIGSRPAGSPAGVRPAAEAGSGTKKAATEKVTKATLPVVKAQNAARKARVEAAKQGAPEAEREARAEEVYNKTIKTAILENKPASKAPAIADLFGAIEEKEPERAAQPGMSLSVVPAEKSGAPKEKAEPFAFEDEKVEQRFKEAGKTGRPFTQRAKEYFGELFKYKRQYKELDPKTFMRAIDVLRRWEAKYVGSSERALKYLQGITAGLDPEAMNVFERVVLLRELRSNIQDGLLTLNPNQEDTFPFGFETVEQISGELDRLREASTQEINEALMRRESLFSAITEEAVNYKLLSEAALKNPNYFHHKVLEYLNKGEFPGLTKNEARLKNRGWQRARNGYLGDYSTVYLDSEYEVLSQMIFDIETAKMLDEMRKIYDQAVTLKAEAKESNNDKIYKKAEDAGPEAVKELDLQFKSYSQVIAVNVDKIIKKIGKGYHPSFKSKDFSNLIEAFQDVYRERQGMLKDADNIAEVPSYADLIDPDVNKDFFPFLQAVLAEPDLNLAHEASTIFKAIAERNDFIKESLGKDFVTWEKLAKERGLTIWQPKPGNNIFKVFTITQSTIDKLMEGVIPDNMKDRVREMLAVGTPRQQWAIPAEVAATLDKLHDITDSKITQSIKQATALWKEYKLNNIMRVLPYNLNNASGDFDITLAALPGALKSRFMGPAFKDAYDYFIRKKGKPEILDMIDLGVLGSSIYLNEISDVSKSSLFKFCQEGDPNLLLKAWNGYWEKARDWGQFRESVLRIATYRYTLEQWQKGNKVYGAANRQEVNQLPRKTGKAVQNIAAKISRETVGDYGAISEAGRWLRQTLIPFYSFQEVNASRYLNLMRNLAYEIKTESAAAGVGKAAALGAVKLPKLLLAMGLYQALVALYNRTFFPEEDKDLRKRGFKNILILGHSEDGRIQHMRMEGSFADWLDWLGAKRIPTHFVNVATGAQGPQAAYEQLLEELKVPEIRRQFEKGAYTEAALNIPAINKLFQMLTPGLKLPFDLFTDATHYPDFRKPMPLREKGVAIAQTFDLDKIYKVLRGIPQPKWEGVTSLVVQSADPGQESYYAARELVSRFLRDAKGKDSTGNWRISESGNALYYTKQAMRYGDHELALFWANEYIKHSKESGVDPQKGMQQSLRSLEPKNWVPQDFRREFEKSLSEDERQIFIEATQWYRRVYRGGKS